MLLVGGYGAVGTHAARTLRALHPALPLVIAGRRLEPAETLARTLGHARAITVDLARPDLGLTGIWRSARWRCSSRTHTAGLGNTKAAPPGLHLPETLIDPSAAVAQLHAFDVRVRPLPDLDTADNRGIPAR